MWRNYLLGTYRPAQLRKACSRRAQPCNQETHRPFFAHLMQCLRCSLLGHIAWQVLALHELQERLTSQCSPGQWLQRRSGPGAAYRPQQKGSAPQTAACVHPSAFAHRAFQMIVCVSLLSQELGQVPWLEHTSTLQRHMRRTINCTSEMRAPCLRQGPHILLTQLVIFFTCAYSC